MWWKFWSLLLSLYAGLHTLVMAAFVVFSATLLGSRHSLVEWLISKAWAAWLVYVSRIQVEVRQQGPLPDSGFLLLFNHTSHIDILVIHACMPRAFRFGAKIELFKIPLFGWAMKKAGALAIDRSQRQRVLKVYEAAAQRVLNGEAFALAPEGTRQTERQIGKFKTGPFLFALQARAPIVPVVLSGMMEIMPKNSLLINEGYHPRRVIMEIGPAVSSADYDEASLGELQDQVRNSMERTYQRLNKELGLN